MINKDDLVGMEHRIIDRCKAVERGGLYVMVFLVLLNSCGVDRRLDEIQQALDPAITELEADE
jgi:hypothetical protein